MIFILYKYAPDYKELFLLVCLSRVALLWPNIKIFFKKCHLVGFFLDIYDRAGSCWFHLVEKGGWLMERQTLSVREVAEYIGVHRDTVYALVREGEIPHVRLKQLILFRRELIDAWFLELECENKLGVVFL